MNKVVEIEDCVKHPSMNNKKKHKYWHLYRVCVIRIVEMANSFRH